jgi:hypothetical protein
MKRGPYLGGRGYWTMYTADDRVGAIFNENFAGATAEWIEWNLDGVVVARTPLTGSRRLHSRAYDGKGHLYAQFPNGDNHKELRRLDTRDGQWVPVRANLPDDVSAFLLGADGDQLVYRVNRGGHVRLIWAKPD